MSNKGPGHFFDLFFTDDIMDNIHAQQYPKNKTEDLQQHPHSRCTAYQSKPIELREIKAALGMILKVGIISLPSLPLYWSTKWPFQFPSLTSFMSRNLFQLILKFLHFNNNENQIPRSQPGHDRYSKFVLSFQIDQQLIPEAQEMGIQSMGTV